MKGVSGERDTPWHDETELRAAIFVEKLTVGEIAEEWGCSRHTIGRWVKRHGIEINSYPAHPLLDNERWLRQKYETEGLTAAEIGDQLGCADSSVSRWLNEHGIDTSQNFLTDEQKEEVARLYTEEYLSMQKIADEFGCSVNPVFDALHEMDIDTGKSRYSGHRNEQFNGGKYLRDGLRLLMGDESWYETKRRVRERAGRECEMCGGGNGDKRLDVHHIIPILSGGCNADELLMALCRSCHAKADSVSRDISTPIIEYGTIAS